MIVVLAGPGPAQESAAYRIHVANAEAYFEQGDFGHAVREYEKAYDVAPEPKSLRLVYNMAYCQEQAGARNAARRLYEEFLRLADPADPKNQKGIPHAHELVRAEGAVPPAYE